jgi:hypothetical protein
MNFDVAFRHQQALDPSALTTIGSTLHAISKAMEDCRNAGVSAEEDPAVILLARHFSAICDTRPAASELQGRCMEAIKDLRGAPVLVTLAHRGVDYDAAAKNAFHSEGQKAMRALAKALQLDSKEFEVRSSCGGPAVSGEIILHTEKCYVQLSLGLCGLDKEVLYRTCRGRDDYTGGRNHFAGVRDLVDPQRFARRIVHELQLDYALPDQAETLFG